MIPLTQNEETILYARQRLSERCMNDERFAVAMFCDFILEQASRYDKYRKMFRIGPNHKLTLKMAQALRRDLYLYLGHDPIQSILDGPFPDVDDDRLLALCRFVMRNDSHARKALASRNKHRENGDLIELTNTVAHEQAMLLDFYKTFGHDLWPDGYGKEFND